MNHVIQIKNLGKIFKDFWHRPVVEAVKDLNLTIQQGEVFGLLGPNGSGKSTTLKMMLGLLRPTNGTIELFEGHGPEDVAAKARLGYLPEVSHLHEFLTPRETLLYYASLFGLPQADAKRRTKELLQMVGLESVADRAVGKFSKGMARRVGLAQALINAPELLILDEPTSGLDPIGCREVKDLVRLLAKSGVTVLMTSHLLADVEDVCDRVAIMNRGELCAYGSTRDLLRNPDVVRFSIPGLSAEAATEIRHQLEQRAARPVHQDFPEMSLEAYFLKVVSPESDNTAFKVAPFLENLPTSDL
jgi:ABC-2 type transport system ATP-binding protein